MVTKIAQGMMADDAVGANQIDDAAVAAILAKLGITDALTALDGRLDTLEAAPAVTSVDVGDFIWSSRATKSKCLLCQGQAVSRTTYATLFALWGSRYGAGDGSTTFNLPNSQGRSLVAAGTGTVAEAVAAASWNVASDVITVASNAEKWPTGRKARLTTTGALPTGFALATDYFVIRLSATTIQLANSLANALIGAAVNFTAAGSGVHTITHTFTARALADLGGEESHALTVSEIPAHAHDDVGYSSFGGSATFANEGSVNFTATTATASAGGSGAHNIMQPYQVENLFVYTGV